MKFLILNRKKAVKFSYKKNVQPFVIISITDSRSLRPNFYNNKLCLGVLSLQFDDIEIPELNQTLFSNEDYIRIMNFFEQFKNKTSIVVIHCEGGISRSAAICCGLYDLLGGNIQNIFEIPLYYPNRFILEFILEMNNSKISKQKLTELYTLNEEKAKELDFDTSKIKRDFFEI